MTVAKSPEEEKREQQRMQDVLVLLQHLAENEETTIKLIIECLYDVGSVNFINRQVQNTWVNQLAKSLASLSKPAVKHYGLYRFKKDCPELILNFLQRKVAFPSPQAVPSQHEEVEVQSNLVEAVEFATTEVQNSAAVNPTPPVADATPVQPITSAPHIATVLEEQVASNPQTQENSSQQTGDDSLGALGDMDGSGRNLDQLPIKEPSTVATKMSSDRLADDPLQLAQKNRQIQRLQVQIQALTALWVSTLLASGAMVWHLQTSQQNALKSQEPLPASVIRSDRFVE
jgi:hypothetical protein